MLLSMKKPQLAPNIIVKIMEPNLMFSRLALTGGNEGQGYIPTASCAHKCGLFNTASSTNRIRRRIFIMHMKLVSIHRSLFISIPLW